MATDLAAVRELMRNASSSFQTLRATHRLWRDWEALNQRGRHLDQVARTKGLYVHAPFTRRSNQPSTLPRFRESRGQLWVSRPSRLRLEHEEHVQVIEGDHWWESFPRKRLFVTGQDEGMIRGKLELDCLAFLLDPSSFASVQGLSLGGNDSVSGRAAIRVRSPEPADPDKVLYPGIGWAGFSTEYELWVDVERGVLLRTAERFKGSDCQVVELLEVAFDTPISDEVFRLDLPPGEKFRTWEEIEPRQLSLQEAARSVPFTVYAPADVPKQAGTWDGEVLFEPWEVWLGFDYLDPAQRPRTRMQIFECQAGLAIDERDLTGYERLDRGGQSMLIRAEESDDGIWHSVRLERDSTQIRINAMLDREATIAVALSLKPVPVTS